MEGVAGTASEPEEEAAATAARADAEAELLPRMASSM